MKHIFRTALAVLVMLITACSSDSDDTLAFTLGGKVSGLNGTVVLQNNNADKLTVSTDGTFAFAAILAFGSPYDVKILTQPTGQTCTASKNSGVVIANVTDVSISCVTNTYTVSGNVSGLQAPVVLQNNNGDDYPIAADGNFTFTTEVAHGGAYDVTVKSADSLQDCAVTNGSGIVNAKAVSNVSVNCALKAIARVSVAMDGTEGNGMSISPSMSADGRYVAFYSASSNLDPEDRNALGDVFVHDRHTGLITRISVPWINAVTDGASGAPSISADGRHVAFLSNATNIATFVDDTNGFIDAFRHDRESGNAIRVSVASDETEANGNTTEALISPDGAYVVFASEASNLVANDTNGKQDVFIRDIAAGTTTRASVATGGAQANDASYFPKVSADGAYVVFQSAATNLVTGDTNGVTDIFVHEIATGTTTRVSVAADGTQGLDHSVAPAISADGRYVVFESDSRLVTGDMNYMRDVYVRDRQANTTTRVSVATDGTEGNRESYRPAISADGRYVTFLSSATTLVTDDTNSWKDVFVRDLVTQETKRVPAAMDGNGGVTAGSGLIISNDGRYVAHTSDSPSLVAGDNNATNDVFVILVP